MGYAKDCQASGCCASWSDCAATRSVLMGEQRRSVHRDGEGPSGGVLVRLGEIVVGVILFAMLSGRLPFDDSDINRLLIKVQTGIFEMPEEIDYSAQNLLRRMLVKEPKQRFNLPLLVFCRFALSWEWLYQLFQYAYLLVYLLEDQLSLGPASYHLMLVATKETTPTPAV